MHKHLKSLTLITCLAVGGPAFSTGPGALDSLKQKIDDVMAKEGISLGGVFRSQYLHASIGGKTSTPDQPTEESAEYTSVDFDIRARPNTSTQGRLVFRMHQDWRNYFSDISNPIFTRWISIDGSVKKMVRYNIGDFRQQYSPLTLYAPEVEMMNEPEIFSRERREAMDEEFLGNHDRILQGVNFNVDAAVSPVLDELHFNLMGTRLRNVETNLTNGNVVTSNIEKNNTEKFMAGTNLDVRFLEGVRAGGTYMKIFDRAGTYKGLGRADTAVQNTGIASIRSGVDVDRFLGKTPWSLGLSVEAAFSSDDSSFISGDSIAADSLGNPFRDSSVTDYGSIGGKALNICLAGGYVQEDAFNFRVETSFLVNDRNFRNEAAQSPTFIGEPVMNIENDPAMGTSHNIHAPYYSTPDALYHHVFKFAPSDAGSNAWVKAPFRKNAYTAAMLTQSELGTVRGKMDPALQLVMPFGPATANRKGIQFKANAGTFSDNVSVSLMGRSLTDAEGEPLGTLTLPPSEYSQMGFGASVKAGGLLDFAYPLTLSGSFVSSSMKNAGLPADSVAGMDIGSSFINAGIFYQFWKRAALLAGVQNISTAMEIDTLKFEETQLNAAAGAEYKIADGAYVIGTVGKLFVDGKMNGAVTREFAQIFTNIAIRVKF